tara:strand:- start:2981 stop:3652 length:672 start_codon:yes stop_codon:yes gene_type:complete
MRKVALDIETTGLDFQKGHRIVEIGCVELQENFPTGRIWQKYINPQRNMPQEAYEIHGLTEEFLEEKPIFKDVAEDFLGFIDSSELIIHNARFDLPFINHELEIINFEKIEMSKVLDTLVSARQLFPGMPVSLDALCKRYKIDNSKREKHGALLDAELLAEVFLEMQGGRQKGIDLKTGFDNSRNKEKIVNKFLYSKKIYQLTNEELNSHKNILKKITNNKES